MPLNRKIALARSRACGSLDRPTDARRPNLRKRFALLNPDDENVSPWSVTGKMATHTSTITAACTLARLEAHAN